MRTPVVLIEFEGVLADTSEARRVALERGLYAEGIVLEGRAWADASAHRSVAAAVRAACATAG
ncbi:MAG: hypothetical protein K2X99_00415, partial [Gemmatimonadaceae bacterium]|nr:hypothetical protein [Gemmatimonadaceae bacterium]